MPPNNPPQRVDFYISSPDNEGNDGYVRVNIKEQVPVNDPSCKHTNVVPEPTEELGEAFQCVDCKMGWIQAR